MVEAFYSSKPRYSYWNACSTGGKQGLTEAQRYPDDYDGIVEGDPASFFTHLMFGLQWNAAAARKDPAGPIPPAKFAMLHQAVLKACESPEGVADGVVNDPTTCHFDPRKLACSDGDKEGCLTEAQVRTVQAIYDGAENPRTGERIFPGEAPGSELGWTGMLHVPGPTVTSNSFFKGALFKDPNWKPESINFDADLKLADEQAAPILNAMDPDLKAFKAHGGKLIMYHGWSDPIIVPMVSVIYYDSVVKKMGGENDTREFVRLFMVPGMGHCGGGPGADSFDKMAPLEKWVEKGIAPDEIIASHMENGKAKMTRPLCPYPKIAQWNGTGNRSAAASFSCVNR